MDIKSTINFIFQNKVNTGICIFVLLFIVFILLFLLSFVDVFINTDDKRSMTIELIITKITGDISQRQKNYISSLISWLQIAIIFVAGTMITFQINYIFDPNIISIKIDENYRIIPVKKSTDLDLTGSKQVNRNSTEGEAEISIRIPTLIPTPTPTLSTSEAVDLIKKYFVARKDMLGRSHSTEEVDKYTTGELRNQLLDDCGDKECSDSIPSLRRTKSYYEFPYQEIIGNQNVDFTNNDPNIRVIISGVKRFFPLNTSNPSDVKSYCGDFIYTFKLDKKNWKISSISQLIKKNVCPIKTESELESYSLSFPNKDISPCNTTLSNIREKIAQNNGDISVEFTAQDISNSNNWYLDMPKDRSQELRVSISRDINNVMSSSTSLNKMASLVIKDCKLVTVITYGIYKTDYIRSFGLVNGVVQPFKCVESNRYGITHNIMWGQQSCL